MHCKHYAHSAFLQGDFQCAQCTAENEERFRITLIRVKSRIEEAEGIDPKKLLLIIFELVVKALR